jgi:hypothetical protein
MKQSGERCNIDFVTTVFLPDHAHACSLASGNVMTSSLKAKNDGLKLSSSEASYLKRDKLYCCMGRECEGEYFGPGRHAGVSFQPPDGRLHYTCGYGILILGSERSKIQLSADIRVIASHTDGHGHGLFNFATYLYLYMVWDWLFRFLEDALLK